MPQSNADSPDGRRDHQPTAVDVGEPLDSATGIAAVASTLNRTVSRLGVRRTVKALALINQPSGFDCPGCAWPEPHPSERKRIEFCENGAKAVAEEATRARADESFFATNSVEHLRAQTDYWLGEAGRIVTPMLKAEGDTHFRAVPWDHAFDLVAESLRSLPDPNQAVFYTSGRSSNEAAFTYQLMVKCFGTNNLPDCSNMCHEPTGLALDDAIGIGKGSVRLEDFYAADTIIVAGQNPGTNHPRMLAALETAKHNGARIIAINPLPEAGLLNFKNPQTPRGLSGIGTDLADIHLPIRIGADHALFQLWNHWLLRDAELGEVTLDRGFIDRHCSGFEDFQAATAQADAEDLLAQTGMDQQLVAEAYDIVKSADRMIICWAMGITQHVGAAATIGEIVNLALLGGHIGRTGAGLCPVRGHSNVQGDRTMGIWEKVEPRLKTALEDEFGIQLPADNGTDTVDAVRAFRDGKASVFVGLGGNFLRASPDTSATEAAMSELTLTVNLSTKLNRSHLVTNRTSLILPVIGRTEVDRQTGGEQFITVEDSMGMVHASTGTLEPPSPDARSEVSIIASLAQRLLGSEHPIDWLSLSADYDTIRDHIDHTIPGFNDFNARVRQPGGFELPHPPRDSRSFETSDGRAHFTIAVPNTPTATENQLMLQTMRSHDQYNTTIYGHDDRYRGLAGNRHVVLVNPVDIERLGFNPGDHVDLVSRYDGQQRRAKGYQVVSYPTPLGCAAAYYPETNILVPLDHHAPTAQTPASKSIAITLEPVPVSR